MFEGPLPVGSVVRLKGGDALAMVAGFEPIIGGARSDYLGVVYPCGLVTQDSAFCFDTGTIAEVVFRGHLDEEGRAGFAAVRAYRRLSRETAAQVERLIATLTPERVHELAIQHAPIELPKDFELPEGLARLSFE